MVLESSVKACQCCQIGRSTDSGWFNPFYTKSISFEFVHQMLNWFHWNQLHIWWTNFKKKKDY